MATFNYKTYTSAESAELLALSHQLAVYSSTSNVMGLPTNEILQWVNKNLFPSNWHANESKIGLPSGWREIQPEELGLNRNILDSSGFYKIESPLTGWLETGPQAKVVGEFNTAGEVSRVGILFAGTNSLVDVADYFQLNEGKLAPKLEPLLNAVKTYALEHHLHAENILITGYSLGGGMVNIMARFKDTLADGFFNQADYIGHAAPVIYDSHDVFNMGYENDVVFRIVGNEANVLDAIAAGKPGLINPDKAFDSSVDNIVLFNDVYASPLWAINPFSIVNLISWSAHLSGMNTDAISRLSHSAFYDYTSKDSTIIIDQLSALSRYTTWVEDKAAPTSSHHNSPAFIIGNDQNNLLKGGVASDYIDAGKGNDTIQTGHGADRIEGGSGTDTLQLDGARDNWQFYRLSDGTLFAHAQDHTGLKQASHIEQISFNKEWLSKINPLLISDNQIEDHTHRVLTSLNHNIAYQHATEGSSANDTLQGITLFGQSGHDTLYANQQNSLLHGGEGNDMLFGNSGNDELYGAEGNDWLMAGSGQNQLYGGVGNDIFAFSHLNAQDTVMDFNSQSSEHDCLLFDNQLFNDSHSLLSCSQQIGHDVYIHKDNFSLIVKNFDIEQLIPQQTFAIA